MLKVSVNGICTPASTPPLTAQAFSKNGASGIVIAAAGISNVALIASVSVAPSRAATNGRAQPDSPKKCR